MSSYPAASSVALIVGQTFTGELQQHRERSVPHVASRCQAGFLLIQTDETDTRIPQRKGDVVHNYLELL